MDAEPRRRRRLRAGSEAAAEPGGETSAELTAATAEILDPGAALEPKNAAAPDDRDTERGLRGLVGAGTSQITVGAAMRARDAARPTEEQLAHSDEDLVIVRRGWVPREQLPRVNGQ